MKKLLTYSILFFILFLTKEFHATHVAASEMTYRSRVLNLVSFGGLPFQQNDSVYVEFTFTLKVYRDCRGVALDPNYNIYYDYGAISNSIVPPGTSGPLPGAPTPNGHPNYYYFNTPADNSIFVQRTSITEVPLSCSSLQTECTTGGIIGYEEHVYVGTDTIAFFVSNHSANSNFPVPTIFPIQNHSNVIRFYFDEYARNNAINNLNGPGGRSLYNQSLVHVDRLIIEEANYLVDTNSSPRVNQPPIFYGCVNEPINFNNITIDPDNDSIAFRLITPLESNGAPLGNPGGEPFSIPFNPPAGNSYLDPFNSLPFTLNNSTGQLTFTPGATGQYVFAILITEYSRNRLTGNAFAVKSTEMRDYQFVIQNCAGPGPNATGPDFDTTTYNYYACYNEPFCFDVLGVGDGVDTNFLTYNNEIDTSSSPLNSFTVIRQDADSTIVRFCWDPGTFVGTRNFTITSALDVCPYRLIGTYNYNIIIDTNYLPICQDTIVYLDSNGQVVIDSSFVWDTTVFNPCPVASLVIDRDTFLCADIGNNVVNVTVTYSNGITRTCQANVLVVDTIHPNISCNSPTLYLGATGQLIIDTTGLVNSVYDNCGIDSVWLNSNDTLLDCLDTGVYNATLYVRDATGFMDSCTASLTVLDTIAPTINCLPATLYLDANGNLVIDTTGLISSTSDNCSVDSVWINANDTSFSCVDTGIYNATIYVMDGSGNIDSCVSQLTILDTVSPFINCQPANLYLDPFGVLIVDTTGLISGFGDNCGVDSVWINSNDTLFGCVDTGIYNATIYVRDASGNMDSCMSQLTIIDSVRPVVICRDTTIYLDATGNFTIDSSYINNGSNDACGIQNITLSRYTFNCIDTGLNAVTMYVRDVNGNIDSCFATVTVLDTIHPSITCQSATLYLDNNGNLVIDTTGLIASVSDNCGVDSVWLNSNDTSFGCVDTGIYNATIYVMDPSGNMDSCVSQLTILDTIAPYINCQPATLYLDPLGVLIVDTTGLISGFGDNCGVDSVWINANDTLFGCADTGLYNATIYVQDAAGNIDSCISTLTIVDSVRPNVICKDTTVYLDVTGMYTIDSSYIDNGSSDACGIQRITLSRYTFTCADTGVNGVIMYVTDVNGNIDSCSANVTVIDTIGPLALCQDTTIYLDALGQYVIDSSYIDNGSNDACGLFIISQDVFDCTHVGPNNVRLWVYDGNNNVDSCDAIVTVLDTINPIAICQDSAVYLDSTGQIIIDSSFINNGSNDACGIATITLSRDTFNCIDTGANIVTMYVTDVNGNVDSCFATITIRDSIFPPANAGIDDSLCAQYTYGLGANTPPGTFIGTWTVITAPNVPVFTNVNDPNATISNLIEGTYELEWMVTNGVGCNEVRDTMNLFIYDMPIANAGVDTSLCNIFSLGLYANTPAGSATGIWTDITPAPAPSVPFFTNPNNPNTVVSNLDEGSYTFVWTASNGNCASVSDTMQVHIYEPPIAFAGADQMQCGRQDALFTATAPVGTSTGMWSLDPAAPNPNVPTITTPASRVTTVTNLIEGTYTFVWTVSNGVCPDDTDTLILDVYDSVSSNAGVDTNLCAVYNYQLNGNPPPGRATGFWFPDPSSTQPSTPIFVDSSVYNTTVSGLVEGTYTLLWIVQNGVCPNAIDTMRIHVWDDPITNAGIDSSLCAIYSIDMWATPITGTSQGSWALDPTANNPNIPVIVNPSQYNTRVNGLIEGTYTFVWHVTNGPCYNYYDTVIITVYDQPAAIVGPDQNLCDQLSTVIAAVPLTGTSTGTWYLANATPNNPTFNPATPTTTVSNMQEAGTYTFYFEAVNGTCPVSRDTIIINNYPVPRVGFTQDTTEICQNDCIQFTDTSSIHPSGAITNYYWTAGNQGSNLQNPLFCFPNPGSIDVQLIVESDQGCRDTITKNNLVTVYTIPIAGFNAFLIDDEETSTKIQIQDQSSFANQYWYDFGDGDSSLIQNPQHTYYDSGFYDITQIVRNSFGCADTLVKTVYVHILTVYVPNTFTPDGDGKNEGFVPVVNGDDPDEYLFRVFNRWGELLFQTQIKEDPWDGTFKGEPSKTDTYVWTLKTKYKDGDRKFEYRGHVNLLR